MFLYGFVKIDLWKYKIFSALVMLYWKCIIRFLFEYIEIKFKAVLY